jgi:hypothetical protein
MEPQVFKVDVKRYKYKTGKEDFSPFGQLYTKVFKRLGIKDPKEYGMTVSNVVISPTLEKDLKKLCLKWIKSQKPWFNKKLIEGSYAWLNLEFGPKVDEALDATPNVVIVLVPPKKRI